MGNFLSKPCATLGVLAILGFAVQASAAPTTLSLSTLAVVRQSSSESVSTPAAMAVDGNTGTLATTQNLTNSWFEVELPVPYLLTRVEIVNPSTGNPARLAGLTLRVQDIRDQTLFSATTTNPGAGATLAYDLPAGFKGRILRIGLENNAVNGAGDRVVSLAEVRLIGEPILVPSAGATQITYSVYQSSSLSGSYPASNALDGNNGTFTHTANTTNSYWLLSYSQTIPMQRIEVVNRTDCCAIRMAGLVLRILDASSNTVATTTLPNPGPGGTFVFTPPSGTLGKSVKIGLENGQKNGDNNYYVTLAEVRVIQTVAYQSSNHDAPNSFPASFALDGNTANFTHTDSTTPNNYWQVNLGQDTAIDRINVINRAGCCPERMANLVLRVINSASNTVATTMLNDPGDGGTFIFDPPGVVTGRVVKIGLEGGQLNGGGNTIVSLAEVQVIGPATGGASASLALNKPSYMTRHLDSLAPASNGNDGNFNTESKTTTQTVDGYWEVDLGREFALYQVTTTAPAGFNFKMNKTTLRLYDNNHESVFSKPLSSASEVFATLADGPRRARYVRIGLENKVRTSTTGGTEWYIGCKEVEVFGRELSEVGILSFGATATNIAAGASSTLEWDVEEVRELRLEPGVGSVGSFTATNGVGSIMVSPTVTTEYVLIATNGVGNSFAATTVVVDGLQPDPVITEFVADNRYSLKDGDGEASDWLEIHNPRNTPLDLSGYGLSDDPALPFKWVMPSTVIPAHGFLIVFASGRASPVDPAGHLHAPFRLDASGDSLLLTAPGGSVVSSYLAYAEQSTDLAYGRTMAGLTRFLEPTPGSFNHTTSYEGWLHDVVFSVPRGYKTTGFSLTLSTPDAGAQILTSTTGVEPATTYTGPISVTTTRSVRATTRRTGYKPPRTQTHTYIFIEDVITAPTMVTSITQDPQYSTRLRTGLTELLTLSINVPVTPVPYTEQAASVEWIWPSTGENLHANCGVMRFANAWTDFTKRSFRLKFRSSYGLANLRAPLFEGFDHGLPPVEEFDDLDVRSGSQDMSQRGFYMAPAFVDDTMNDMGSINPHGRYINVYLNGAYYGKFHLRERMIDRFLADYLGGRTEDYVSVRGNDNVGGTFVNGTPDPVLRASWERVRTLATNYNNVKPYLDVNHFIDFLLVWFYGNCENEYRAAGSAEAGSGFKFYLSDPDGFLRTSANGLNTTGSNGPGGLLAKLVTDTNPDFKMLFADRTYKHFFHDGAMTPAKMSARLTARMNQVYNAMVPECARWNFRTPATWASAEATIQNTVFPLRTTELLGFLRSRGLYSSIDTPEFSQHGGSVAAGYIPTLTAGAGTVYYTLNGTDPRLPGGAIAPGALTWTTGAVVVNDDTRILLRLRNGTTWSALNDVTFRILGRVPASAANTLITELHYHPDATSGSEFIELLNLSTNRVDFTNVRFTAGITYTFPSAFSLNPGQFVVLAEDPSAFAAMYQTPGQPWYQAGLNVLGPYTGKLSNNGETLTLLASNNTVIASFAYDTGGLWPARADGSGSSLELRDPSGTPATQPQRDAALSLSESWRSSLVRHGSPGRLDAAQRTVTIHEVLSHTDLGVDWIELRNQGSLPADLSGRYLTDDPLNPFRFTIPNGTVLPPGGFVSFSAAQLGFGFSELGSDILLLEGSGTNVVRYLDTVDISAMAREETAGVYTRSDGQLDFTELRLSTRDDANSLPRTGPVVISEVMYKPATGFPEYIELANISAAPVPLCDPANPANTWELDGAVEYRFPASLILPAGSNLIVCATNAATFRALYNVGANVMVLGPWGGSLNNAGENLKLRQPGEPEPNGFVPYYRVDHLTYEPVAAWPVPPLAGGASLIRQPLQAYGNDPAHWELSAQGGTPGTLSPNHPPVINVTGTTTVPAGQSMNLTLFAADLDAPWQSTVLQIPSPPAGATYLPSSGAFSWTPSEAAGPQALQMQVIATDNGTPALSVTNTVTLTVTEPFRVLATSVGNQFTAAVIPGQDYEVEYTDSLTPPDWVLLQTVENSPTSEITIVDPSAPAQSRRYYRVKWLR